VFSHGADGVRIEFDGEKLLSIFDRDSYVRMSRVKYKSIRDLSNESPTENELPFFKRDPYKDECEFRVIYKDNEKNEQYKNYEIKIECIRRITLSPWLPTGLANSIKDTIHSIENCKNIKTARSTLVQNERWQAVAIGLRLQEVRVRAESPDR
jgi:hypothetical protein